MRVASVSAPSRIYSQPLRSKTQGNVAFGVGIEGVPAKVINAFAEYADDTTKPFVARDIMNYLKNIVKALGGDNNSILGAIGQTRSVEIEAIPDILRIIDKNEGLISQPAVKDALAIVKGKLKKRQSM